jgi:D-alanine-D-alanine ligase
VSSEHPSILVLCGGLSAERDVSLRSGSRVAEALRGLGFTVASADVDASLLPRLTAEPPDCVVPVLHGAPGEDGALRDVLGSLRLPFVGSTAAASRLAFDKPVANALLRTAGVAVPDAVALPHAIFRELGATAVLEILTAALGLPLVVKPTRGGSSLGTSIVHDVAEMPAAMVGAFAYGDVALIQRYVAGTEIAVSVVEDDKGARAFPPVEIVPDTGFYDYTARYTAGTTEFFAPARLAPRVAQAATDAAATAHRVLGLRDYSRTDLIVDEDGTCWFLEVNVAPGLTETSLMPQALLAAETDLGHVMAALVRRAMQR